MVILENPSASTDFDILHAQYHHKMVNHSLAARISGFMKIGPLYIFRAHFFLELKKVSDSRVRTWTNIKSILYGDF